MSTTASETAKKTQSSKHFPYDIRPGTYFGYQHMCYLFQFLFQKCHMVPSLKSQESARYKAVQSA